MSDDTQAPLGPGSEGGAASDDGRGRGRPVASTRESVGDEVRTRSVVVVDEAGVGRVSIGASASDGGVISFLDGDGFWRIHITASVERGAVSIATRAPNGEPTRVDVFGLDPDGPDAAYVGVEVIDRGTSVAGIALQEGRAPQVWTASR